jgi:hypothetical protein
MTADADHGRGRLGRLALRSAAGLALGAVLLPPALVSWLSFQRRYRR